MKYTNKACSNTRAIPTQGWSEAQGRLLSLEAQTFPSGRSLLQLRKDLQISTFKIHIKKRVLVKKHQCIIMTVSFKEGKYKF